MKKKKAVAYTRVSTNSSAQVHSYEYQNEYWQGTITQNPNYEFAGIYADKGISGSAVAQRPQLLKMLEDARKRKFDVIFTKSVARFARNTEELLSTVRELRDLGIKVVFEKENIDTFDPSSEVFLTVAAAVAENDLKIYSENQKWSIREKYKNGFISIGNKIFGYRMDNETNTLIIVPEQAETVKRVFELCIQGYGLIPISKILTQEGRKNIFGEVRWGRGAVRYILSNEKYKGCSLAQKTVTDFGVCRVNKGQAKKYYMEDTHEPIVSKEEFELAQEALRKRATDVLIGKAQPQYPFSHKVMCGVCSSGFSHKIQNPNKPWKTEVWVCQNQHRNGQEACTCTRIKDTVLIEKFIDCYNEFIEKKYDGDITCVLKAELQRLLEQERELVALRINRMIDLNDYNGEIEEIRGSIETVKAELSKHEMNSLKRSDYKKIQQFNEEKVEKFIDRVIIRNGVVTFRFINGVEISRPYTNGQAGNQKGWMDKRIRNQTEVSNGNS